MEEEVIAWRVDEIRRWVDRREERVMKGVKKKKNKGESVGQSEEEKQARRDEKGGEKEEEVGFRSQSHFRHRNLTH